MQKIIEKIYVTKEERYFRSSSNYKISISIATMHIKEITALHKQYMVYILIRETKTHTIICSDIYMYIGKIVYFSK